jgi:hypothetical protein
MKSFLVDIGNSSTGPLGAAIRVTLPNEATNDDAIAAVREFLEKQNSDEGAELFSADATGDAEVEGVEYVRVYINPANLTVRSCEVGDIEIV